MHLEVHFVVSEMQITPVYGACQEQNTIYCTVTTLMLQGKPKSLHSKDFRPAVFLDRLVDALHFHRRVKYLPYSGWKVGPT